VGCGFILGFGRRVRLAVGVDVLVVGCAKVLGELGWFGVVRLGRVLARNGFLLGFGAAG